MTTFVGPDAFSGTAGADLNTYTGAAGVTYARNGAFSARPVLLTGNGTVREGDTSGLTALYVASATPPNADYYVQGDLKYLGSAGGSDINGVCGRWDPTADTGYFFAYRQSIASWILYKHVAGAATSLATAVAATLTNGSTYTLKLVCSGTTISGYVNGTLTMSATDTAISGPGRAAMFLQGTSAVTQTNTSGYQLTNFQATTAPLSPATSYTQSLSSGAGYTGSPVTITFAGNGTTTATITPAVSGVSGTFSPTTIALSDNSPVTVTFTPTTVGTATLTSTNSGSLTDPSAVTYTVTSPPITLGVTSAAARFSPGNWLGDTGRGGSSYRITPFAGAYFDYTWNTTAGSPTCVLNITNATSGSTIAYDLNGIRTDNVTVPSTGGITIPNVVTGNNSLRVYTRQSAQSARWNLSNAWKVTGLTVDSSSSAITAAPYGKWARIAGDSITEGIQANGGVGNDSNLCSYSFLLGQALLQAGYDYCTEANGYNGWEKPGDSTADVPGWYVVTGSSGGTGGTYSATNSRWPKIANGVDMRDANNHLSAFGATGTEPDATIVNFGTNEALYSGTYSTSDTQASVTQWLTAERGAAPNEWIFVIIPFGLYESVTSGYGLGTSYITAIKNGVAAYQAANPSDAKVKVIDLGPNVSNLLLSANYVNADKIHPSQAGHALLAPLVAAPVLAALTATTITTTLPSRQSGELGRGR